MYHEHGVEARMPVVKGVGVHSDHHGVEHKTLYLPQEKHYAEIVL